MKIIQIIITISALTFSACSNDSTKSQEDIRVEEAAHRDANRVINAEDDIFEQEKAVIDIRIRENALRDAGFDNQADLYISIIDHILVDSLHIVPPYH